MEQLIPFSILPQPDLTTCGPTCLHAVYEHYGEQIGLETVIAETFQWAHGGGTAAVFLGCHALRRGFRATIYSYNLQMFDPTWFHQDGDDEGDPKPGLVDRLREQVMHKTSERTRLLTDGYFEFFERGGKIRFEVLNKALIRSYLNRDMPILTGLSATYLYQSPRELPNSEYDDVRGEPAGHFVVLHGYRKGVGEVLVADPYGNNPAQLHNYAAPMDRVINAILLGTLTYDANLLILEPPRGARERSGSPRPPSP